MFELVQLTLHVGIFYSVKSKMKFFVCANKSLYLPIALFSGGGGIILP